MTKVVMNKLNRLELIEERIKKVEDGFNDLRNSIDFAHAEVVDLKEDNKVQKIKGEELRAKIEKLEQENTALNGNSVIDLKARSMRDNLIFCNIEETERENTTDKLHGLLEEKMGFKDAAMTSRTE
jgi:chromosome segregation ATPase